MKYREDLRHLNVCSVDPPGCTDIDDALHFRELENGNIEVFFLFFFFCFNQGKHLFIYSFLYFTNSAIVVIVNCMNKAPDVL